MRAEVLRGEARPEGLSAVAFHGFVEGLRLLCTATPSRTAVSPTSPAMPPVSSHRELLHLIANMVLQAQSEVMHVY